jgi:hypothetical protein
MNDPKGYYQKYRVERVDGRPVVGRTFTLEFDRDPFALPALRAYRDAVFQEKGEIALVVDLDTILSELEGVRPTS